MFQGSHGPYDQLFLYAWIGSNKFLLQTCVKGPSCLHGFPTLAGHYTPNDRVTLETDLPTAFVDAKGAALHAGVGSSKDNSYYPTTNLLSRASATEK